MKIRKEYTCPLEIVHDFIKGKWKTIIIFQFRNGNMTLSELQHSIEGITQKMLIEQLKELKDFGIINKLSSEGYPLHVEYFLTNRGIKILEAINIMQSVGVEYMIEHGQSDILEKKGICVNKEILTKK